MAAGTSTDLHVAIVGGGITGVILALGLEKRGVSYTIYERAPAFTEIGAGIGFSPNAERAQDDDESLNSTLGKNSDGLAH